MELSASDKQKVQLITAAVQVEGLVALLANVDMDALTNSVKLASPNHQKLMKAVLEFSQNISSILLENESNSSND